MDIAKKLDCRTNNKDSLLINILKIGGLAYSIFLGSATVGAIGRLAYSLITGDINTGKDIAYGAIAGAAIEPLILGYLIVESHDGY